MSDSAAFEMGCIHIHLFLHFPPLGRLAALTALCRAGLRIPLLGLALVLCGSLLFLPVASGQSTEAPVISSPGPFEVAEGDTAVTTLTATDTDTATTDLVWSTIGGDDEASFTLSSSGELAFTGAKDYENPDDADTDGSYEVTVQVSDGTNTDSVDLVVMLTDVPEPPSITTAGPLSVAEGETAVATLTATDDETAAADLTWSTTGGADQDKFTLTEAGVLTLNAAADFENPDDADADGSYELTVQVSDGTSTDSVDLVVDLTNVTELAATITGSSTVSFDENSYARVATYSASSDEDRDGVTWTITGDDAALFSMDNPSGALRFDIDPVSPVRFSKPPDYEDPDDSDTDNVYSITLQASAGADTTSTFDVSITVTDVDEAGTLSLSDTRPSQGTALTLTLTDPDGVTAGTSVYKWERSLRPNAWAVIAGATASSYTPTAADTGTFLRATATYEDGHGAGKTTTATTYEVVTAALLTGLLVTTTDSTANADRALSPTFSGDILHYVVGCTQNDTMTVTPTAAAGIRLSVNGVQVTSGTSRAVSVDANSDVRVAATSADGASTTYVVHCLVPRLWTTEATKNAASEGIIEDLMVFPTTDTGGARNTLVIMDHNGVPRFRRSVGSLLRAYVRVEKVTVDTPGTDGFEYRYSYITGGRNIILDQELKQLDTARTVSPLTVLDAHDQRVLENGNYLLMAWPGSSRDLSGLPFDHDSVHESQPQTIRDSAFQIVTPTRRAVFTWNSWGIVQLDDCVQHRFPDGYAHLNSLQMIDGLVIVSLRGCSKVLAIDPEHEERHKVAWRLGRSNLSDAEWEARNVGPAPLTIVGDPAGEFCGQHAAQVLPNGNLLLHDNGVACVINPWTGIEEGRTSLDYSRAVEYALDLDNGEAVFVRDHSLHNEEKYLGYAGGHVEPLANGDWLISWGGTGRNSPPIANPPDEQATQVDPDTGEEKFAFTHITRLQRTVPVHPVALFSERPPLEASFPASTHTSVFHTGATDSPQVVVAFNRPVVDFDETSPSLSVTGATVASVSAHVVAGEPANAYLVTLTPEGAGAITLTILANQACDSGGICAADDTRLTSVPAALVIGPPPSVTFERATQSVAEGSTLTVYVRLSAAHQGVRGVTVPVLLDTSGTASADDLTAGDAVTFEAGELRKTLAVEVLDDDLVEGAETATLTLGTLPEGLTTGTSGTSTVTLTDADRAQISYESPISQVAEGGTAEVSFTITNGVTFERDENITLTVGGTATPGDDFILLGAGSLTPPTDYAITFPAGDSSTSFEVLALDDSAIEATAETITLSATLDLTGASLGTRTVTIPPSDVPDTPTVTISGDGAVTEGEGAAFTLSRTIANNLPLSEPLTVSLRVTARGSTLAGPRPATATFEAGEATASVEVATLDDRVVEPAGRVTVLVRGSTTSPPLYLVGVANAATVTVEDNDTAAFTVEVSAAEVAEGSAATVTIAPDGVTFAESQPITLTLGGTATPGDDYTVAGPDGELVPPYTVTLPAGATTVTVTIQTLADSEDDVGETVEVTFVHDGVSVGTGAIEITAPAPPPPPIIGLGGGGGPTGPTPSEADFEWTVKHDIEALASGHDNPTGLWSDGTTLWLAENGDGADDAVYAYDLETGERVEGREFALDERNRAPRGVASDGTTVWVADSGQDRLFAYDVETGERLPGSDLTLDERNRDVRGIWSDGTIMWVLDGTKDSLFAYDLATGTLVGEYSLASQNGDPHGLWSDGVTLWVSDAGASPRRLFAYRVPTLPDTLPEEPLELERVRDEEFEELSNASNNSPRGIWSDGEVMYVADASDGRVYTYNMPDAIDARLEALEISGVDFGEFSPLRHDYASGPIPHGNIATLTATPAQADASVDTEPPDHDGDPENGYQLRLIPGLEITVTVTSQDGLRVRAYRVALEQPPIELALEPGWTAIDWPGADGAALAEVLPEGTVAVYAWDEAAGTWLAYFPAVANVPGLNTLTAFSTGETYWVALTEPVTWTPLATHN